MSPPAVENRSPVEKISSFLNPTNNFDQRNMDPSFSVGFGASSGQNTKTRQKPRLVKLRKNSRKVKAPSFSGEILSGFNPFAPPSEVSGNDRKDCESPGNTFFVFGANGSVPNAKASPSNATVTPFSDEEFSTPKGDFELGSESSKEHSDDVVGIVDNDQENIRPCSESTSFSATNGGRFDGGEDFVRKNDRNKTSDSNTSSKSNGVQFADGKTVDHRDGSESNLVDLLEKLNISDSIVNGGRDYEEASKSNNTPVFTFGSVGKSDPKRKEGATTSGPCSFSSNGFHKSNNAADEKPAFVSKTTNVSNLTDASCGTRTSLDDFKVPEWDPSSLKDSLFPKVSKNPVDARRNRSSKDKRSKKVKERMKQCELDRCKDQTSEGIEGKFNSPGNCSPMDYSPYRGEKVSNQSAPVTPLTSVDPSHSREHVNPHSNEFKVASARDSSLFTAEDHGSTSMPKFSFSASTSQGTIPHKKIPAVKKYRRKVSNGVPKNNLNATMRNKQENQPVNTDETKQDSGATSTMPDVCEVWRLRGNQAYKSGNMCKAEECYTHGINSSPSSDHSEYSMKPLALCYGNRAAVRISLGRLREAISDCDMAASFDPSYIKAFMRAANCHLVLGELESAVQYFNKCMEATSSVCLDRRSTIEAAEGLQQAKRVADFTSCASMFLEKKTPDDASEALVPIANALSISSCSEKLLQIKAEALFMIRRYKEVIELCEDTLQTAERNFLSTGMGGTTNVDGLESTPHTLKSWRWSMISKSHFYLGNLEKALNILEKLHRVGYSCNENQDSPGSLVATISELLQYKNAGNEAVRNGKYMEAVEQYTAALSKNVDSRPFAAICYCNRAAANQALNQITDAIADCSLAMALDENYTKAVSRRATLHEMIRDYDQAASDLQKLISMLVKQSDKTKTPESSTGRSSSKKELKQARQRLSVMEEKSKESIPLDFFLIMGVKTTDTNADVKKAYRKAALRHHPDKAAHILVKSESEGPRWKEILEEVHKGADRLFKMIGEAYSVLSDPTKRSDYEQEEEIRKARASRESYRSRKAATETSSPQYQTSANRRYWKDSGRTYRDTPYWW